MSERHKHLEFLRKTAKDAAWRGDYENALTLCEDGLALARSWKDRGFEELFTCNRATTLLEMDRFDFDLGKLKEIFFRNPTSYNGVLAAYVSSHAHEKRGEYERAVFYARACLQRSQEQGFDDLITGSLNSTANLELHESRFESARDLFRQALDRAVARGEGRTHRVALYSDNLGYCHIALDQVEVGLPLVRSALTIFETLGARQALDYPCLDLCFAYLKLDLPDEAESWGTRALALGREFEREDVVKNSHYLLAEAYSELGREEAAETHYDALASYYPDFPALKNYLHQISLMGMINLRA
jgi:tetratricopeptide (TPR) repeat protein